MRDELRLLKEAAAALETNEGKLPDTPPPEGSTEPNPAPEPESDKSTRALTRAAMEAVGLTREKFLGQHFDAKSDEKVPVGPGHTTAPSQVDAASLKDSTMAEPKDDTPVMDKKAAPLPTQDVVRGALPYGRRMLAGAGYGGLVGGASGALAAPEGETLEGALLGAGLGAATGVGTSALGTAGLRRMATRGLEAGKSPAEVGLGMAPATFATDLGGGVASGMAGHFGGRALGAGQPDEAADDVLPEDFQGSPEEAEQARASIAEGSIGVEDLKGSRYDGSALKKAAQLLLTKEAMAEESESPLKIAAQWLLLKEAGVPFEKEAFTPTPAHLIGGGAAAGALGMGGLNTLKQLGEIRSSQDAVALDPYRIARAAGAGAMLGGGAGAGGAYRGQIAEAARGGIEGAKGQAREALRPLFEEYKMYREPAMEMLEAGQVGAQRYKEHAVPGVLFEGQGRLGDLMRWLTGPRGRQAAREASQAATGAAPRTPGVRV